FELLWCFRPNDFCVSVRCDILQPFVARAFAVLQVYFIILLPRVNGRPGWDQSGHELTVSSAAGDDDATVLATDVHECKCVPLRLKNVDRFTGDQLANHKRTHLCAIRVVEPTVAIFSPVVDGYHFSRAIVYRKTDVLVPHSGDA